jgi:hypothetical protein
MHIYRKCYLIGIGGLALQMSLSVLLALYLMPEQLEAALEAVGNLLALKHLHAYVLELPLLEVLLLESLKALLRAHSLA